MNHKRSQEENTGKKEGNANVLSSKNLQATFERTDDPNKQISEKICSNKSHDQHAVKGNFSNKTTSNQQRRKRKQHKNSKNGCANCRQRKIKCDELLPSCSQCKNRNLSCSYLTMTPFQIHLMKEGKSFNRRMDHNNNNSRIENDQKTHNTIQKSALENDKTVPSSIGNFKKRDKQLDKIQPYKPTQEINLNSNLLPTTNTMYQMHEMEGILLPASIYKQLLPVETVVSSDTYEYIPMSTKYNEVQLEKSISSLTEGNINTKTVPLSTNTRASTKSFVVNHTNIILYVEENLRKASIFNDLIQRQQFHILDQITKGRSVDFFIMLGFYGSLNNGAFFDKLLRKANFLFAMDYYKNTLLKQKILPKVDYQSKISICDSCEKVSVILIDDITKIIKSEYLSVYDSFNNVEILYLMGSFFVLNACLSYHFKSGHKYDLTYDNSKRAVQLSGIFLTGLYSLVMDRSSQQLLMSDTNMFANYLSLYFKAFLLKNYNFGLFQEFGKILHSISNFYNNNVDYENLKLFCDKYTSLITANIKKDSILGVSNTFVFRITNSYLSILPFTFTNMDIEDIENCNLKELDIILVLCYLTAAEILSVCFNGSRNIVGHPLADLRIHFFSMELIMKLFKFIKTKKLQLVAIYLIRTQAFLKANKKRAVEVLRTYPLGQIINDDDPDMSIQDRYLKVKKLRDDGIAEDIPVKSFSLFKGQFFKKWNYYNQGEERPNSRYKVSNNKIMNSFKDHDTLIEDFIRTGTGFFSLDNNGQFVLNKENVVKDNTMIDGFQIKIIWKITTYMRINDL